jgi:carbonic anhydrase
MENSLKKLINGYQLFREKYVHGDSSIMSSLADHGQKPKTMVVACCDSRVDPALLLQCDPGDLFVVRNVANIVPPYEKDDSHHGTSAALEFAIKFLQVKHLILLGHSQCGGIQTLLNANTHTNDFITNWVSIIKTNNAGNKNADEFATCALKQSYENCLTFPWIKQRAENKELAIHLWFFDIKAGQIFAYSEEEKSYKPLKNL